MMGPDSAECTAKRLGAVYSGLASFSGPLPPLYTLSVRLQALFWHANHGPLLHRLVYPSLHTIHHVVLREYFRDRCH